VEDLRLRLEVFAHDSMAGREAGTPGHERALEFIAAELKRIGATPAGEGGTYFQAVPLIQHALDRSVPLRLDGVALRPIEDYAPIDVRARVRSLNGVRVVYGGTISEAGRLVPDVVTGRFVVFSHEPGGPLFPQGPVQAILAGAAGVGIAGVDSIYPEWAALMVRPSAAFDFHDDAPPQPVPVLLPTHTAERLFGRPLTELRQGDAGATLAGDIRYHRREVRSRNVIAVLPGSDPALRGQYVALGAHSDHDGVRWGALDHDSLRALNLAVRAAQGSSSAPIPAARRRDIEAELAARRAGARSRADSIFNGADDDGSGSMALLELAEYFADPANRPRRSLLFVWHTAEEKGLQGSEWFTDHPTVPRDSIVAQLNIDMIGRGGANDLPGGGDDYVQLLGPRRLSSELGALIEAVNARRERPFRIDYQFDAPGHPEQYYCRSDHWNYARYGIPVAFFSTGDHADYHQLTDEVAYIDFQHYAAVVGLIGEVAAAIANLDQRVRVDGPVPGPGAPCVQ